jgi:hypothetical protein
VKVYLITMLILQVVSLGTTSRTREPYTDGEMGAIALANIGFIAWIIYLMHQLP